MNNLSKFTSSLFTALLVLFLFLQLTVAVGNGHIVPGQKIVALDRAAYDQFGISVVIDGDWLYAGNYLSDLNMTGTGTSLESAGSVYVYKNIGDNKWKQVQKIVSSDRDIKDQFGRAIAVSGNYMIVGARYENHNLAGTDSIDRAGAVYIFERDAQGTWNEVQKIIPDDRDTKDEFGFAVSIDSAYAIVGASQKNGRQGAAYVIERNGSGTWETVQKILPPRLVYNIHFGANVQLQGDKAIITSTQEYYDENDANSLSSAGGAYYYKRLGTANWVLQQKIVASDREAYNYFGNKAVIDGDYLAISSISQDKDEYQQDSIPDAGAVYIYKFDGTKWNQTQKIVSIHRSKEANFGSGLAMKGNRLIIGEPHGDFDVQGLDSLPSAGSAYLYELEGSSWSFKQKLLAHDREDRDWFGISAAIDENTVVVGAIYESEDTLGLNKLYSSGSAYTFVKATGCAWLDNTVTHIDEYIIANQTDANYKWLDCNNNLSPIASETEDWIAGFDKESYAVEVSKGGCIDTSDCVLISITGVNNIHSLSEIECYPNPTSGFLNINLGTVSTTGKAYITTLTGETTYTTSFEKTTHLQLPLIGKQGLYFLHITNDTGKTTVIKVTKN